MPYAIPMTVIIWGLDRFVRWSGGRWGFIDIRGSGVVVQEIESPDFRSLKVRISEMCQPVAAPKAASVIQATHPPHKSTFREPHKAMRLPEPWIRHWFR